MALSNKIIIQQGIEKGILGGPYFTEFSHIYKGVEFLISVNQIGVRTIEISTISNVSETELFSLFHLIDSLIMLFDGQFIPIEKAEVFLDNAIISDEKIEKHILQPLKMYTSSKNFTGQHLVLCNYINNINSDLLAHWETLQTELDIIHTVMLYQFSDNGMPVDFTCAIIIECFNSITELLKTKDATFKISRSQSSINNNAAPTLWESLNAIITHSGKDIFAKELKTKKNKFISVLRNSRVRVMHIKRNYPVTYLNGLESVVYSWKLQLLYRKILLDLLDINASLYISNLKKTINSYDQWNNAVDTLLNRL